MHTSFGLILVPPVADAPSVFTENSDRRISRAVSTQPGAPGTARRFRSRALVRGSALIAATAFGLAAASAAHADPVDLVSPVEFTEPGCGQTFTVPAGVTKVTIVARGAAGGGELGGKGMELTQDTDVTPGEVLDLCVGTGGGVGGDGRLAPGNAGGGLARVSREDAQLAETVDIIVAPGGGGQGTPDDAGEVLGFAGGDAGTPMQAWAGEGFGPAGGAGAAPFSSGAGGAGDLAGVAGQQYAGGAGASDLGLGGSGGGGGGAGAYGGGGGGTWLGQSGSGGGGGSAACTAACESVATTDKTAAVTISWATPKTATATTLAQAPKPVNAGESVTLTAHVSPVPTGGTVAFATSGSGVIDDCTAQPVNLTTGAATCTVDAPSSRYDSRTIAANYSGDDTFAGSGGFSGESVLNLAVVFPTDLSLDTWGHVSRNSEVTHTAHFAEYVDGGRVTFTLNGTPIAGCTDMELLLGLGRSLAPIPAGLQVTCDTTAPATGGDHLIAVTYTGSPSDEPAAATATLHVRAPRVTASPLLFAGSALGTPVEQVVTIENDGDEIVPFSLAGAKLRGAHAAEFAIVEDRCAEKYVGPEPRGMAADPSCTVTVRFTPTVAGDRTAELVLVSAEGGEEFAFTLAGTTPAPAPAAEPAKEAPKSDAPKPQAPKPVTGAILAPAAAGAKTQGTITKVSRLTLPLNCPTWMPCTVSGRVITDAGIVGKKGSSGKRRVRHLIAFKGVKIGNGKTVKVSRKVGASALKLARRNKRKTVTATLVINTVLQDGTKFESRQQIKLGISR